MALFYSISATHKVGKEFEVTHSDLGVVLPCTRDPWGYLAHVIYRYLTGKKSRDISTSDSEVDAEAPWKKN